ncbi:serine/threonine protein kinase [Falsiroseomonas sp.]|uniref:serine/threonine protein kinase n=1 Tax=Falsiroseomonas sp. TaxID=2870721 RepID=UPI003568A621
MARHDLSEGQEIDGFRIGARLHQGGMAALWEATHPAHDLPLLVKVPRLAEGDDPAAIVSFEMEQMILPRLSGPHVPRFLGAGGFDRQPYLAMERIPGPTLLPLVEELPLRIERIAEIGARVADALDALHRQHVVHLDIKPSNILTRPTGEAVLVDFGLSHHRQLPDLMQEEFRLPYGTAPYMAPEQVMRVRSDPRSDLFALGAMLYFLTTGARPHGDPQRLAGLKRRLWRDPIPPRRLRADCPDWLQEIILRCLEVLPERRHPTAAQLAFDLRHPDRVALTARARKARQDGFVRVMQRRFGRQPRFARPGADSPESGAAAPLVVVAVDLAAEAALLGAMRATLGQILATLPGARLACVYVLQQLISPVGTHDEEERNPHLQRLIELKHWAAPLRLPEGRATFHVLEAASPAAAILDHARLNGVDHIVIGARAQSLRRRVLGSVCAAVASEVPCSVTVVRTRQREQEP